MQVHSVRNTYHYNQPLNNNKSPNFKANGRAYFTPDGLTMGCISWMFRNDIDWKRLAKYEHTHFIDKPKVNVVIYAASDGSEAYTKAISLIEALSKTNKKEANKFFPIICYDLDDNIVQAANSGLINTGTVDRMNLQMNCENYEDYFSETTDSLKIDNDVVMPIKNKRTLKAKSILTEKIRFRQGDMFKKILELEDNSNTVLMCRNVLAYFESYEIENFVRIVSNKLKQGSLFIIGDHDTRMSNIQNILYNYGFEEVMKNVYKKAWKRFILLIYLLYR